MCGSRSPRDWPLVDPGVYPHSGPNEGVEQRGLEVVVDEIGRGLAGATAVVTGTAGQSVAASGLDEAGSDTGRWGGGCAARVR